jgi:tryptophan halogenase
MFNPFRKKRIAVVGAGNAGCITALHYLKYCNPQKAEIIIYHNPEASIERVGQGTVLPPTELIGSELGINWDHNPIDATIKTGFMYEGWGKKKEKIFHDFKFHQVACHYVPQKLSDAVLQSGKFKVIEQKLDDLEREVDADYIFDCRGRNDINPDDYTSLVNPLNSVLLYNKPGADLTLLYTRSVATPNGWTFIIPNKDSLSYGYLYNNTITSKEEAMRDFLERFELPEVDGELQFNTYVAKDIFVGERTIINGSRCFFMDPLEATATDFYHTIAKYAWDYIGGTLDKNATNIGVRKIAKEVQNFILWHYRFGSKYDTPFWEYAKSLPFNPGEEFKQMMKLPLDSTQTYGNWTPRIFDIWRSNIS